jgi:hypothetical protein
VRATLAAIPLVLGACALPLATGNAVPAATVGTDRVALAFYEEAPAFDLVVDQGSDPRALGDAVDIAPLGAGVVQLSFGLRDNTDVEGGLHLAMHYFGLPVPAGGMIGARQQLVRSAGLDASVYARIGGMRASNGETDMDGNPHENTSSLTYAAFGAAVQPRFGRLRPVATLQALGGRASQDPTDQVPQDWNGLASSITIGLLYEIGAVQVGPAGTFTYWVTDLGNLPTVSGGFAISYRP